MASEPSLPWLNAGDAFPDVGTAWPAGSDAPGLLAMGGSLDPSTLIRAYTQGIFPWFSDGQPLLWWSPDPRMVLNAGEFKLHRSLKRTIKNMLRDSSADIRFDTAFDAVIGNCSQTPRHSQTGTWILPNMVNAYRRLHHAGYAHSVETWVNGQLVGGLYCVSIGRAVFGESMFCHRSDASKLALAALVCFALESDVQLIDCQQNTRHLASLGAREIARSAFISHIQSASRQPAPAWHFSPLYWRHLLDR